MSRFEKLIEALASADARCTWQGECHTGTLEQWILRDGTAIFVQTFKENGVEVYTNKDTPMTMPEIIEWLNL